MEYQIIRDLVMLVTQTGLCKFWSWAPFATTREKRQAQPTNTFLDDSPNPCVEPARDVVKTNEKKVNQEMKFRRKNIVVMDRQQFLKQPETKAHHASPTERGGSTSHKDA